MSWLKYKYYKSRQSFNPPLIKLAKEDNFVKDTFLYFNILYQQLFQLPPNVTAVVQVSYLGGLGGLQQEKKKKKPQERRNGEFNLAREQSSSKLNWLALDQNSKRGRKPLKFQNEHLSI